MPRVRSERVGEGACPSCGRPVVYRRSSGGLLSHRCDHCESSGYAEPNGPAYRARMATIKPDDQAPAPAPTATPKPPPAPAPADPPKPSAQAFDLANL